ncbi:MAG: Hpt domain-containing protein [Solirubrobacteraceae bacterium]
MEVNEYLPMFLAESREHLQDLNLAVVRVEETPDDADTIDEIFRIAHSLKGMSATMGFARIAALTHAMEDLFEVLRIRRGGLEREAIDVLLECLDALSAAFEAIDTEGEEKLEQEPLVERLEALVRSQSEQHTVVLERPDPAQLQAAAGGRRVVHVLIRLDEAALMPSVRALMALTAISDHGEILASLPAQDAVEQFDGDTIEAWLASEHEDELVQASVLAVPDVAEVILTDADTATAGEPRPAARKRGKRGKAAASVDASEVAAGEPEAESELAAAAAEAAPAPAANGAGERRTTAATSSVRVDAERLDQLMHVMGELVVHRTHVESLLERAEVPGLHEAMNDLTRSSQALQAMVMQVRMIPVEAVFLRFPRLVRDLSGKLDKKVELLLSGSETELDRTVVDQLGEPPWV